MIRYYQTSESEVPSVEEMDTMALNQLTWPEMCVKFPESCGTPQKDMQERDATKEEIAAAVATVENLDDEEAEEKVSHAAASVGLSAYEFKREWRLVRNQNFLCSLGIGPRDTGGDTGGRKSAAGTSRSSKSKKGPSTAESIRQSRSNGQATVGESTVQRSIIVAIVGTIGD